MKLGIVCPYDLFRPGGVQEHVLAEQRLLQARGHTVKLLTPQPRAFKGDAPKDWIFLGQSTKLNAPQNTTLEVSAAVDLPAIDAIFEAEKFDILHFHEPLVPLLSRQLLGRCNAVTVGTFHAALADTVLSKSIAGSIGPFVKSVVKHLDVITAVSPAATDYISPYVEKPIHLISNGIDLDLYRPLANVKRSTDTILYVGRLEKRKGVTYLLDAFAELQKAMPEAKLQIAGTGPERKRLEEQAEALELNHVKFLGFISDEEKKRLMNECSVFCSPAIYGESFGIVILEAMAMGACVVAGDNPGYAHVLQERGAMSLVNSKDTADFARHLKLFLTDNEVRTMWSDWAKDYIKQFDYNHIIDQYEELFEEATE